MFWLGALCGSLVGSTIAAVIMAVVCAGKIAHNQRER